jgi:hypothetical protein
MAAPPIETDTGTGTVDGRRPVAVVTVTSSPPRAPGKYTDAQVPVQR